MTARWYEMGDDDLSRQRRKRDERLLAQPIPGTTDLTVGDLVADVLAATEASEAPAGGRARRAGPAFDMPGYLADRGHDWPTIKTVVDYVERHDDVRGHPAGSRSDDAGTSGPESDHA